MEKTRFKIGDTVKWDSQSKGRWTTKQGKVVAVLKPKVAPQDHKGYTGLLKSHTPAFLDHKISRDHVSILVSVTGKANHKPKLYWPRANKLS